MRIKNTNLTAGLRDRLETAGSGRTLDIFQDGPDVYVGAELAAEEQIEVVAIAAAHAVEPFDGRSLEDAPDGYDIDMLFSDEIAAIREARGSTHVCARYAITKTGGLKTWLGEKGDTMPHEAWAWLTAKWLRSGGRS